MTSIWVVQSDYFELTETLLIHAVEYRVSLFDDNGGFQGEDNRYFAKDEIFSNWEDAEDMAHNISMQCGV